MRESVSLAVCICVCSCVGMWKVLLYPLFDLSNYFHLFIQSASFLYAGHWAKYWGYKDERQRFLPARSSLCSEGEKEVNTRAYAIRQISQGAVGTQMKIPKARLGGSGAGERHGVWKQEKLLCKVLITYQLLTASKGSLSESPKSINGEVSPAQTTLMATRYLNINFSLPLAPAR